MKKVIGLLFLSSFVWAATPEIIILRTARGPGGNLDFNYLFWIPVDPLAALPGPSASAWTGASVSQNAQISAGTLLEESFEGQAGSSETLAQIEARLQVQYAAEAARINALPNPIRYYGSIWDGTTWTVTPSTVTTQ